MGRPPRDGAPTRLFPLRLTEDERTRWTSAAAEFGLSLAALLRSAVEREIKRLRTKGK